MKLVGYAFLGAVLLGFATYLIGVCVSQYQVRVLLYSPDRAGVFLDVFFFLLWPLSVVVGAIIGWRYAKNLEKRRERLK